MFVRVVSMNIVQIAYLAGIIDGEGSIMLSKYHQSEFPCPCISISSTDLELLEWIRDKIGAGRINRKKNYNIDKHKTSYTYAVYYDTAIDVMSKIEPYLVITKKKLRAKFIIENYKTVTIRNGKYNDTQRKAKEKFYHDFMEL
jgi:hypothetical protein